MTEADFIQTVVTYCCNTSFNLSQHKEQCEHCKKAVEDLKKECTKRINELRKTAIKGDKK
ncbi:MAG: hypothetical protein ACTSU7_00035 [Candidatus Heimdallarchaeaceae archaeon]